MSKIHLIKRSNNAIPDSGLDVLLPAATPVEDETISLDSAIQVKCALHVSFSNFLFTPSFQRLAEATLDSEDTDFSAPEMMRSLQVNCVQHLEAFSTTLSR